MTGYSVSGVAHGEQVSIRDRKRRVKRVGKYSIWDGTYDAGRRGKRGRFERYCVAIAGWGVRECGKWNEREP
jgi:hypothetical protein